jgi:integrase/recombinase XerC
MPALVEQVRAAWATGGEFTDRTLDKCGETVARFARRLEAQGVSSPAGITPAHCQGFVDAATIKGQPPELTTRHARRSALRMLFRSLRRWGTTSATRPWTCGCLRVATPVHIR